MSKECSDEETVKIFAFTNPAIHICFKAKILQEITASVNKPRLGSEY